MSVPGMPMEIAAKLRDFLAMGKTGSVVLGIKKGRIMSWKVTEYGDLGTQSDIPIDKRIKVPIA